MSDLGENTITPEQSVAEVLENISDAFFALDRQWRFTYLNGGAERMLRRTRSELLGQNIWTEFPDAVQSRFYTEYHRTMEAGVPSQFEEYYPAPLDAWYEVRAYPTPTGMAVYFQDSTEHRRVREQIRETADRLSLAMDASGLGDYVWDVVTDRVHLSLHAAKLFGVPADIPITRNQMLTMVDAADSALAQERVAVALKHQGDYRIEYRVHRPDGSVVWIATRGRGIYDENGKMTRLLGVMQDITERRNAEDALRAEIQIKESLRSIGLSFASKLELQDLLQAITDAGTRIVRAQFGAFFYNSVTAAGESYILYTISGVPREKFSQFPMPRNTAIFGPTFEGTGTVRIDDVTNDPRYGKNAPYHGMPPGHLPVRSHLAVSVKSRTGDVIGGLLFGHEQVGVFTEHDARLIEGIAAQAAVALDNARLYDAERRARADAEGANRDKDRLLESERAARTEAERASRTKDEFLATVSHELRTPLNAMLGWSQLLSDTSDAGTLREGLDVIRRNARVQAQLIEDLLDMSRIISGKLRLDVQRVDLPDVIHAAIESVQHSADARGVRLVKILDPAAGAVSGDANRLQQIVWNLLSNAIKFTPKGGHVQITLRRVDSQVEIAVTDSGIGIAPDFLPHVFERFRQADASTTRKHGGLGLGLSIVKSLIELHGGSAHAQSPGDNQGSTFIIVLPIAAVARQAAEQPPDFSRSHPPAAPDLKGLKILVVDDEPDARALLDRLLKDRGAEVQTAGTVSEALEAFKLRPPDLLISDIGIPDQDGYDLIRQVRALPAPHDSRIPAIALTAFARSEDRTRAMRAGYQMHLPKPIEAPELLAAIATLAWRV
ncbi:MAG TPA: ATP-binding protein [Tepidisphaeraceae bacterium]|jgi:PAS domain S-box-containing protein|nr:ATP-binding protein [Tepidisphaeraceae bacterium]